MGRAADWLWNPWLLGLFLVTGLVYSIGSGFFQLFSAKLWLGHTLGSLLRRKKGERGGGGLSSVQALSTALASTMGTGSIAGVAAAIAMGGPGAVFWMWVSAFLGMMTSCGEKLLSVQYQRPTPEGGLQGGPMFYLRDGARLPVLAVWFSLACLPATVSGGALVQSAAIARSLQAVFGFSPLAVGICVMVLAGAVLAGGLGRIAKTSSLLVPGMALLYLGCGGAVLILRTRQIPSALRLILSGALSPRGVLGGCGGWTVASALRYGVARGVFTNEAGLGTSAMAHGAAKAQPAEQGMWGIFEVFLSTLLVCTVTALVVLTGSTEELTGGASGAELVSAAFSAGLGAVGGQVVALSLLLFAFSSILGWSYYGQQALEFLPGGRRFLPLYRVVFLLALPVGAVWESQCVWQLVDLCAALMALPNLVGLLRLAPEALIRLRCWAES